MEGRREEGGGGRREEGGGRRIDIPGFPKTALEIAGETRGAEGVLGNCCGDWREECRFSASQSESKGSPPARAVSAAVSPALPSAPRVSRQFPQQSPHQFWGIRTLGPCRWSHLFLDFFLAIFLKVDPLTRPQLASPFPFSVTQRGAQANASKRKQTQTNADKRKQTQRRKRKQTQTNADKRGQTRTNAYTPLYCGFLHPPLQSPNPWGPVDGRGIANLVIWT